MESSLMAVDFKNFVNKEEKRRGHVLAFKGEANTTVRSFLSGLFGFVFTRRITTASSYNEKAKSVITINYIKRIHAGEIGNFPIESVEKCIQELQDKFEEKDKTFWGGSGASHVARARIVQRALCYHKATQADLSDVELIATGAVENKNADNSIKGAFKGMFEGFFRGLLGFALVMFVLWAVLNVIVYVVELF
jgi:hypothetical protein